MSNCYAYEAYKPDVPLNGPNAPPVDHVDELIQRLVTIRHRFGNTAITFEGNWGSNALYTKDSLRDRIECLEDAIRKHRDQRGDDRCWQDDEELYKVLPEGYTPPARDSTVELAMCQKYIACRHNPNTQYVSPQRRIEELEKQCNGLKAAAEKVVAFHEDKDRRSNWSEVIEEYIAACKTALVTTTVETG